MASGFAWRGVQDVRRNYAKVKAGLRKELGRALRQETEIDSTEVKRRTPVDTGELRGSVHVVGPIVERRRIYTMIVAGGPAAPYARIVHEDLDAFHKVGQAKYLESVILESRPHMAARVARRIELNRALA